jgi:HlyD family secretion protein
MNLKNVLTKKRLIIGGIIVVMAGGYWWYHAVTTAVGPTTYVTSQVQRGLFIGSLSGTGQVSSNSQVDVKPLASGQVTDIFVKEGQVVKKGDKIAQLDPKDALTAIRNASQSVGDAQTSLGASRLSLAKLKQPATTISVLQAQNAVDAAQRALDKLQHPAQSDIDQAQSQVTSAQQNAAISSDGVTPVVIRNAYDNTTALLKTTIPTLSYALSDSDSILAIDNSGSNASFSNLLSVLDVSQKTQAMSNYGAAKSAIASTKALVDALPLQNADPKAVDAAITSMQSTLDKLVTLLTYTSNALQNTITSSSFSQSNLDALRSTIQNDRATMATKQTTMVTQMQTIVTAKTNASNSMIQLQQAQTTLSKLLNPDMRDVQAAQATLKEAQQKLADVKAGALPIDIQIAQNSVDQRVSSLVAAQNSLADAQQTLANYTVIAPFDGVIAKVSINKGDQASSGSAVVTLIAQQQFADVTLNEVDAAKVKVGDKVTLTFDAISGLTIAGQVSVISPLGTVTQGVVNYDVQIAFASQDARIRSGMSVSAAIVTEVDQDVVLAPNAAVKSQGTQKYVLILNPSTTSTSAAITGTPRQQSVQVGSANDTWTVITNGLIGGENVVTQTIAPTTKVKATTTTTANSSSIRIPGLTGGSAGGGGGVPPGR